MSEEQLGALRFKTAFDGYPRETWTLAAMQKHEANFLQGYSISACPMCAVVPDIPELEDSKLALYQKAMVILAKHRIAHIAKDPNIPTEGKLAEL
jgi:hypothetical protein